MIAERELILEEMQTRTTKPSTALLSERSVNIYSDLGDTVREGDIITLTGELVGFSAADLLLQWQYDDGFTWTDIPGANRLTHAFIANAQTINYSWRLSVIENA